VSLGSDKVPDNLFFWNLPVAGWAHSLVLSLNDVGISEDQLGKGHSDILSEMLVVLCLILVDGVIDLLENLNTVDEEVLTNVVSEGSWASKDGCHLNELFPVTMYTFTVLNQWLDFDDSLSE